MKNVTYIQHDVDGKVVSCTSTVVASEDDVTPRRPGLFVQFVGETCVPEAVYWDGAGIVLKPPSPGVGWEFDYGSKTWILNSVEAWNAVKRRRDDLLTATDWRVTRFIETGYPVAPEWTAYRQALRDITLQTDPTHIVWPEPPA